MILQLSLQETQEEYNFSSKYMKQTRKVHKFKERITMKTTMECLDHAYKVRTGIIFVYSYVTIYFIQEYYNAFFIPGTS